MVEKSAVLLRVLAALFGGYGLTALAVAIMPLPLARVAGMPPGEAVVLSSLLGILLYLVLVLWAFTAAQLWRVLLVLGGGGLAWLIHASQG